MNFQQVALSLAAKAKQFERPNALPPQDSAEKLRVLGEVVEVYASQRVQLLTPVLGTWLSALCQTSDIVNVLRVTCAHLLQVCEAKLRLFSDALRPRSDRQMFVLAGINIAHINEPNKERATPRTLLSTLPTRCYDSGDKN